MFSCTSASSCTTFQSCGTDFNERETNQIQESNQAAFAFGSPHPESFPSSPESNSDELSPFQPQKIVDNVFLGPLGVAQNESDLDRLDVRMVVSITLDKPEGLETTSKRTIHHFKVGDTVDAESTMLLILPVVVALIGKHAKDQDEVVYVHCSSGISRSAAVVIAYVMWSLDLQLMKAYDHVRQRRACINPNDGFFSALQIYEMDAQNGLGREVTEEKQTENMHAYNAHQLATTLSFVGVTVEKAAAALKRCNQQMEEAAAELMQDAEGTPARTPRTLEDSPMGSSFLGADPPTPDSS
jgi:predicted protein tyrosine phosphatase